MLNEECKPFTFINLGYSSQCCFQMIAWRSKIWEDRHWTNWDKSEKWILIWLLRPWIETLVGGDASAAAVAVWKMWPLLQKHTLRLSVRMLKDCSFAVYHPFAICSWWMGCSSNGLDHPFRKNSSRSNGCWNQFKKNLNPFQRLRLAIQKKIFICLNGCGYLFIIVR